MGFDRVRWDAQSPSSRSEHASPRTLSVSRSVGCHTSWRAVSTTNVVNAPVQAPYCPIKTTGARHLEPGQSPASNDTSFVHCYSLTGSATMTSFEGSNPIYRGPRLSENTHAAVDPELGEGEDEELLSPHPHPHFSQRAPWLRAGVLGVRFPDFLVETALSALSICVVAGLGDQHDGFPDGPPASDVSMQNLAPAVLRTPCDCPAPDALTCSRCMLAGFRRTRQRRLVDVGYAIVYPHC